MISRLTARALDARARGASAAGNWPLALSLGEEAVLTGRSGGAPAAVATSLSVVGTAAREVGNLDRARAAHSEERALCLSLNDPIGVARSDLNMGHVLVAANDLPGALRALCRRRGRPAAGRRSTCCSGRCWARVGRSDIRPAMQWGRSPICSTGPIRRSSLGPDRLADLAADPGVDDADPDHPAALLRPAAAASHRRSGRTWPAPAGAWATTTGCSGRWASGRCCCSAAGPGRRTPRTIS